jgi:transposase
MNHKYKNPNFLWMLNLSYGKIKLSALSTELDFKPSDLRGFIDILHNRDLTPRKKAISILSNAKGIPKKEISRFLFITTETIRKYIQTYEVDGLDKLMSTKRKFLRKFEQQQYIDAVFETLHQPPKSFNINRITWVMDDLYKVLDRKGLHLNRGYIRLIIKNAGYKFQKAKKVLTSNDPEYEEKIEKIKTILSNLWKNENFFSIDEYVPFAVKIQGGRALIPPGTLYTYPQWQKSKGSIIMTAALELSTNQIIHFYSKKKNTEEMIKMVNLIYGIYQEEEEYLYLSWDAASWHASKKFLIYVDKINSETDKNGLAKIIVLAPLPVNAQFLNVIESVFSGMARAIIHNSDYATKEKCKEAIDRYFLERNIKFAKNPKKAGKKIWRKERTPSTFKASNNCKDPQYR